MCFCGCSKTATLEQLSPTTTTTQSQIQCCLQDRMRQSPKQIQILDDQKTSTFKTIREEEAGNSKSMYRTSGSKDIVILYVGNPDTQAQTQTEAVMKVNCVIYLYNVWPSIRSIPHLGLVNTHLSQICQKVLFLFFFFQRFSDPKCLWLHMLPIQISQHVILKDFKNPCILPTTDLLLRSLLAPVLLHLLSTWNEDPAWTGVPGTPGTWTKSPPPSWNLCQGNNCQISRNEI